MNSWAQRYEDFCFHSPKKSIKKVKEMPRAQMSAWNCHQETASHWNLPQGNRLALGSGTDVKSRATFSSGPDPSVRQQAQLGEQIKVS